MKRIISIVLLFIFLSAGFVYASNNEETDNEFLKIIIEIIAIGVSSITLIILLFTFSYVKRQLRLNAISQIIKEIGEEKPREDRIKVYREHFTYIHYENPNYAFLGRVCIMFDRVGILAYYRVIKRKIIYNFISTMIIDCYEKLEGYLKYKNNQSHHQADFKRKREKYGVYCRYFKWLYEKCKKFKPKKKKNLYFGPYEIKEEKT